MPDRASQFGHGLAAAMNIELLQNVLDVILGSGGPDSQPVGDFLVGQAAIHQLGDLKLTARERDAISGAERCNRMIQR